MDRAANVPDQYPIPEVVRLMTRAHMEGREIERERISLGIEGIDTHQIEGTPLRDVLVFREDVFKVIHGG